MDLPTNDVRANWAMQSVELFAKTTGLDVKDELDWAIGDLLANMMHLCASKGLDFDDLLQTGRMHFDAEVAEQTA